MSIDHEFMIYENFEHAPCTTNDEDDFNNKF